MKRYLLFAGMKYYPSGGADDFRGSFDTTEAAKDGLIKQGCDSLSWAQIATLTDDGRLEVVWRSTDL